MPPPVYLTQRAIFGQHALHHAQHAFGQRHVDGPRLTVSFRAIALPQRRHDPEGGIEAGDRIADADAHPHRWQIDGAGHMVGQVAQATDRLADHPEGGALGPRPVLAIAGDVRDDQVRPRPAQHIGAQPHLPELARPEILDHHIALRDQIEQQRPPLFRFQIQRDAALVAGMHRPPERAAIDHLAPATGGIAAARFDLDHVRPQIRQQPGAKGRRHEMADFEYAKAGQDRRRALRGHPISQSRKSRQDGNGPEPCPRCGAAQPLWSMPFPASLGCDSRYPPVR